MTSLRLWRGSALLAAALVAFAGCAKGTHGPTLGGAGDTLVFPSPPDPMARAVQAGLVPNTHETLQHHVHAHLDDGARRDIAGRQPAGDHEVGAVGDHGGTRHGAGEPPRGQGGGERLSGDPTSIALTDHKEIAVVVGKAPSAIPSAGDFGQA